MIRSADILQGMPKALMLNEVNYSSGSNDNIITTIHNALPAAIKQVKNIAPTFKGDNDLETAKNIWTFLKSNIKYKADTVASQDIKLPSRFLKDGVGDCKSYSLFTAAILSSLNIPFCFRYTSYDITDSTPGHVYVVANNRTNPIIIDGVWKEFGTEKKYYYKKDVDMQIRTLSGIDYETRKHTINGQPVGNIFRSIKEGAKDIFNAVATTVRKVGNELIDTAKEVTLAPARGSFLLLVKLNVANLATLLDKVANSPKRQELINRWNSLGGEWRFLETEIRVGKNKKPPLGFKIKGNGIGRINVIGRTYENDMFVTAKGVGDPATITAAIAAGSGIVVAMIPLIRSVASDKDINFDALPSTGNSDIDAIIRNLGTGFQAVKPPTSGGSSNITLLDPNAPAPTNDSDNNTGLLVAGVGFLALLAFAGKKSGK